MSNTRQPQHVSQWWIFYARLILWFTPPGNLKIPVKGAPPGPAWIRVVRSDKIVEPKKLPDPLSLCWNTTLIICFVSLLRTYWLKAMRPVFEIKYRCRLNSNPSANAVLNSAVLTVHVWKSVGTLKVWNTGLSLRKVTQILHLLAASPTQALLSV